jgi:crossover junction endodeoxyribonuclease RusA
MARRSLSSRIVPSSAALRRVVNEVTILLPIPPSANDLHDHKPGRPVRSKACSAWIRDAGWRLLEQRPGRVPGAYILLLAVPETETKADLDNLSKATSDLLQAHGVIDNDRKARRVVLDWHREHAELAATVRAVPPGMLLESVSPIWPRSGALEAA